MRPPRPWRLPVGAATVSQLTARLGLPTDRGPRILVVSAHADDAEIGAAGTIGRLVHERPDSEVTWIVLAAPDPTRADEARSSAATLLGPTASRIVVGDLRDGYLPFLGAAAKERSPPTRRWIPTW